MKAIKELRNKYSRAVYKDDAILVGYVSKRRLIVMTHKADPDSELKVNAVEKLLRNVEKRTDLVPEIETPVKTKHWHLYGKW